MMAELIDRRQMKAEAREVLDRAQVPPGMMTLLYLGLTVVLGLVEALGGGVGLLSTFLTVLTNLLSAVLAAGFVLYCMAVRRGERAEYLTLFDGFSFAGKIILLMIVEFIFITLWAMLFVIPGVVAMYRYRFAMYNLCENPGVGVMEALAMSKRQTRGYKAQLFALDISFLGWDILAQLPTIYLTARATSIMTEMAFRGVLYVDVDAAMAQAMAPLPFAAWQALISGWFVLVSVFYLARKTCVDLGYFETAKRTSGVGQGAAPQIEDGGWNGL